MRAIDYIKEGGEYIPTEDGSKITASQLAERFLFDGTTSIYIIENYQVEKEEDLHLIKSSNGSSKCFIFR